MALVAAGGEDNSGMLEVELASVVKALLTDSLTAHDAIGSLEAVYHSAAERLR